MATHDTPASMLKESLDEYLEAAKYCCDYHKTEAKWKEFQGEGCLGYPSGVLLFAIIDSIGSYFRKDKAIKIKIDGKDTTIVGDGWEHFKILNSKYFGQKLSQEFIKALYSKFRSFLTHNSVLGKNAILIANNKAIVSHSIKNKAFFIGINQIGGTNIYMISLKEVYELCKTAVEKFKNDIDTVVPNSKQGKKFN